LTTKKTKKKIIYHCFKALDKRDEITHIYTHAHTPHTHTTHKHIQTNNNMRQIN